MFRNFRMVSRVVFGRGSFNQAEEIFEARRQEAPGALVFLVDDVFRGKPLAARVPKKEKDLLIFVDVKPHEPTTIQVDALTKEAAAAGKVSAVIGIGGGSVMDLAKAVAVMLTNPGSSADYQGWDLPKVPSIWHAGVPTLSGTGSEVSRTTVLTGPVRKLGINSDYSVFDQIILDPELIADAPPDQRFFTGMDCFIHCVESLNGTFLNAFSQAYGEKAEDVCREIFLKPWETASDDKLMMASYCGGMSIAYSQVGVCHALSYGLAYVQGVRHGVGNSIVFDQLSEFYPKGVEEFRAMMEVHKVSLPRGVTKGLNEAGFTKMISVALSLEPLWQNALGPDWKAVMTPERARALYEKM